MQPTFADEQATTERSSDRAAEHVGQLFVVLLVVAVAQVVRVLFPIMFEIGEDWDFLLAGLVALAVFASPLLALTMVQVPPRATLLGGATVVAAVLLMLRILDPIPAVVAMVAVAAVLTAVTVAVTRTQVSAITTPGVLVPLLLVGLSSDVLLRAVFDSWDLAWQTTATSFVVVIGLAGALVLTSALVGRAAADPRSTSMASGFGAALGAYLMLQLLFLTNFAFVGSQATVGFPVAVGTVLAGAALAVWSTTALGGWAAHAWSRSAVGLVAIVLAFSLSSSSGLVTVTALIALQVSTTRLLAWLEQQGHSRETTATRSVVGAAGCSVLFLVLVLLWSLHIDRPLPLPREMLPAAAAALIALIALRPRTFHESAPHRSLRMATPALAGLAVLVPLLLWATAPDGSAELPLGNEINLVSYNVRGSVDTDGQLAPDRIAAELASSNPNIVVLQEVARGWPIHGTMDLVAYLERELDMNAVYAPAADGQFGNAILSNRPMTEVTSDLLPKDGSQERSFLVVSIETPSGVVTVVGTHLHSRSSAQVNSLLGRVDATTNLIVAGDMNIAPEDPETTLFTETGVIDIIGATGDRCRTTSAEPTSDCDRPDWVFVSPDITIDNVRIGTGGASDHLAIHATLLLGS